MIYKAEAYCIQGAVFEVYRELGCGFLESVYQESLAREFELRAIPFAAEKSINIQYKGQILEQTYEPDFVCYNKIIVEIKAVKQTASAHQAQLLNYIKATGMNLGLLVNFGAHPKATVQRLVL